jgi:hypothetical protein
VRDSLHTELALAELLRERLYRQLAGSAGHVGIAPLHHDRFVRDELIKEASRLCGMYKAGEAAEVVAKQRENVRGKILIAGATEMLGTTDSAEALEILDQLDVRDG